MARNQVFRHRDNSLKVLWKIRSPACHPEEVNGDRECALLSLAPLPFLALLIRNSEFLHALNIARVEKLQRDGGVTVRIVWVCGTRFAIGE
jgi:hypothetical protein